MAKYPALPLFTDAFIADTTHLSAAQTGAYLMLLMVAWRTSDGKLPDDDKILARFSRMDARTWKANRDTVLSFWKKDENGNLYQARLLDERKNVADLRHKNSAAGNASALKRLNRDSTSVATKAQPKTSTLPHPTLPKEDSYESSPPLPPKGESDFEEFWKLYPSGRKGSKEKSRTAFKAALKRATLMEIMNGLESYRRSSQSRGQYAKGTAAWLNDDRWNWNYEIASTTAEPVRQAGISFDQARREALGS